jgi:hypothetical protein
VWEKVVKGYLKVLSQEGKKQREGERAVVDDAVAE